MSIVDHRGEVFFMQNLHIHGYDVGVDSWGADGRNFGSG